MSATARPVTSWKSGEVRPTSRSYARKLGAGRRRFAREIRSFHHGARGHGGRRRGRAIWLDPETLSFERIRGQRNALAFFVRVKAGPVDRLARKPQPAERVEHLDNFRLV